jgi:hypothetical protein
LAVTASYVIINALLTIDVVIKAILPAVVVAKMPVGIIVICPPVVNKFVGGVMVAILVVPDTNVISEVGAMVVAEAIVGAVCIVFNAPENGTS